MVLDRVDAEPDHLRSALGEVGFESCNDAQLGGADRGKVLRVREQHSPIVADPLVKVDGAVRCFRREIGSYIVDTE